jgi:hypothetical protein
MHRDLARVTRVRTVADFVVDLLKADATDGGGSPPAEPATRD